MCHINYLSFSSGLILLVLGFVFANLVWRTLFRGLGIAVVHEILALGTDVRLIQPLLNFNENKER